MAQSPARLRPHGAGAVQDPVLVSRPKRRQQHRSRPNAARNRNRRKRRPRPAGTARWLSLPRRPAARCRRRRTAGRRSRATRQQGETAPTCRRDNAAGHIADCGATGRTHAGAYRNGARSRRIAARRNRRRRGCGHFPPSRHRQRRTRRKGDNHSRAAAGGSGSAGPSRRCDRRCRRRGRGAPQRSLAQFSRPETP